MSAAEVECITESERLRLRDRVEAAFQKVLDSCWEAIVRRGMCWCVTRDCGPAPELLAQFLRPGSPYGNAECWLVFYGPELAGRTADEVHAVALHELSHCYLYCTGEAVYTSEFAADSLAARWGVREDLLWGL
jgi:hypothetical protein